MKIGAIFLLALVFVAMRVESFSLSMSRQDVGSSKYDQAYDKYNNEALVQLIKRSRKLPTRSVYLSNRVVAALDKLNNGGGTQREKSVKYGQVMDLNRIKSYLQHKWNVNHFVG